jgi:hypothetical protein
MELRQDTDVVTLLKQLCVKLAPVDCLYTASFFPTFQRERFGEVNITHLTTIPVLYNVPDLQDALFVKTYFVVGNGKKGLPFCSVDILAHELGHGVVRGQHGLIHRGESGALSESYADILGYAFERYIYRIQPTLVGTANWDVGERVVPRRTKLWSMSNPLECQHQKSGQYWQVTSAVSDSGGVHINAGVPNYCFYLVATRTSPEYALRLWYVVLKHLPTRATFITFGRLLRSLSKQHKDVITAAATTNLMFGRLDNGNADP